jgi:hypothetical protein
MVGGLGERLYKMGYRSDLRLAPEPNLKIGETFHA